MVSILVRTLSTLSVQIRQGGSFSEQNFEGRRFLRSSDVHSLRSSGWKHVQAHSGLRASCNRSGIL